MNHLSGLHAQGVETTTWCVIMTRCLPGLEPSTSRISKCYLWYKAVYSSTLFSCYIFNDMMVPGGGVYSNI